MADMKWHAVPQACSPNAIGRLLVAHDIEEAAWLWDDMSLGGMSLGRQGFGMTCHWEACH